MNGIIKWMKYTINMKSSLKGKIHPFLKFLRFSDCDAFPLKVSEMHGGKINYVISKVEQEWSHKRRSWPRQGDRTGLVSEIL